MVHNMEGENRRGEETRGAERGEERRGEERKGEERGGGEGRGEEHRAPRSAQRGGVVRLISTLASRSRTGTGMFTLPVDRRCYAVS